MRRERARQAAGTESGIHVHTDMKSRETGQPYIEPLSAFSPISTSSGTDFFCATAFLKKRIPPARNSLFYCLQHIPLPAERTAVPLSAHWFARLPPPRSYPANIAVFSSRTCRNQKIPPYSVSALFRFKPASQKSKYEKIRIPRQRIRIKHIGDPPVQAKGIPDIYVCRTALIFPTRGFASSQTFRLRPRRKNEAESLREQNQA